MHQWNFEIISNPSLFQPNLAKSILGNGIPVCWNEGAMPSQGIMISLWFSIVMNM